jgi:hypothetical protein
MIVARNDFDMIIVLYCLKLFTINVKLINCFLFFIFEEVEKRKTNKNSSLSPSLHLICSCVFLSLA